MRVLVAVLGVGVCAGLPQASSAADPKHSPPMSENAVRFELSVVLQRLGINLIPKAYAAECLRQGDPCTANEQCCPGLECTGGPPATCAIED